MDPEYFTIPLGQFVTSNSLSAIVTVVFKIFCIYYIIIKLNCIHGYALIAVGLMQCVTRVSFTLRSMLRNFQIPSLSVPPVHWRLWHWPYTWRGPLHYIIHVFVCRSSVCGAKIGALQSPGSMTYIKHLAAILILSELGNPLQMLGNPKFAKGNLGFPFKKLTHKKIIKIFFLIKFLLYDTLFFKHFLKIQ